MNAARINASARLRRVLEALAGGAWRSTLDIQTAAQVCAVGTCVSELRANGLLVECERRGGAWWYRLAGAP